MWSPEGGAQPVARKEEGGLFIDACANSTNECIEEGVPLGNDIVIKEAHEFGVELCARFELNV